MFNDAQYVVRDWQLNIDVDMVLRGQGADSGVLRQRKPRLIEIAERATREGPALIEPAWFIARCRSRCSRMSA